MHGWNPLREAMEDLCGGEDVLAIKRAKEERAKEEHYAREKAK